MLSEQFQLHAEIEQRHWWFVARRAILAQLLAEVVPPGRRSVLVDVGCGTGANIAALADRYFAIGIDTSAQAIDLARQRFPAVRFVLGTAPDDLGPLANQADAFLLTDVLEHVEDDRAMLGRLVEAARPGSYFLITVPADMSLWSEHDRSFGHHRRYDRQLLERVWESLPVAPRLVSYFNARLYWLIRATRTWGRLRGRAAGQAGTDFWLPRSAVNQALESVFAGESRRLLALLHGRHREAYRRGASLIAILERL